MKAVSMGLMRRMSQDPDIAQHQLSPGVVWRVLRFAKPYRFLITVFVASVVVMSALAVAPPLLFKQIIDQGVLQGNRRVVIIVSLTLPALLVLQAVLGMVQRWFSSTIGEGLIFDLRTQVFDHVIQMPVAFFTRTQTGKLVSRLNSDVIGAQQAFTSTLSTVLSNLISLVLVLAAMLVLSWQLTLAALIMLPIFLVPAKIVGRKLADLTRQQMQLNGDMSATMTERFSVSGALLVKLFGRLPEEHDRFAERAGAVRDVSVKIAMNGRFFFTSLGLVAALATALVYGVGGSLAIDGVLTVGTLTALAALLAQLYGPLTQLTNLRIDVMNALVSFDRVFEVLDLMPMIRDAEDAEAVKGPASVSFEHVSFSYPSADEVSLASLESIASLDQRPSGEVLHEVTFSVAAGQTVALVGRSGGGKTTMTHLIARLYDATSGTVSVAGIDVKKLTAGIVARHGRLRHPGRAHVPRHDSREPPIRPDGCHRGRNVGSAGGSTDQAAGREPARRPGHGGRRARLPVIRGRAATSGHRPAAAEGPVNRGARRGHRASGLRIRSRCSAGAGSGHGGAYQHRHRAPAVNHPQRRFDHCRGQRPDRTARPARGTHG